MIKRECRNDSEYVFIRRYRNRRIGEFLKEMRLTEGRNTGFRKILNALKKNGSPKPLFETDSERLSFCSTIFIHPDFLKKDSLKEEQVEEQDENIAEETVKLLDYCVIPRARREMQAFLQISSRKRFDKIYLKPLLEEGRLKMTVPDKPNSSQQKYIRADDKTKADSTEIFHGSAFVLSSANLITG